MRRIILGIWVSWLIAISGCGDGNDPLDKVNDYDQTLLLENLGENIIYPSYQELTETAAKLDQSIESFSEDPSLQTLTEVREALKSTRISYQWVAPYQFGPAEQLGLNAELNLYPVDENQIESNITEGNYDLGVLSNQDARGFQAIAYLLYSEGSTDEEIVNSFDDEGRMQYLVDLSARILEKAQDAENRWSPTGENYLSEFKTGTGVDAGSSIGLLVNAMNQNFERNTRDGKLGIPIGIRTLGEPVLGNIEAKYAGYSLELLLENLKSYSNLYHGITRTNNDSEGFEDYLEAIDALDASNQSLHEVISNQWSIIISGTDSFDDPLEDQISSRQNELEELFAEMQKMVVYMKTDMASALGVVITYQDNDGD